MRRIVCPLCEEDHTRPVARRRYRSLSVTTVLCQGCGLVYHNPVVEDEDRAALGLSWRQLHTDQPINPRHLRRVQRRAAYQQDFLHALVQPGMQALEIGAGLGVLSDWLQQQGVAVSGIEPDPQQAAYARKRYGLAIITGRFEDVELPTPTFDLILASHVIEHFPAPLDFLSRVRTRAAPEARLFLETPNILAPKVGPRRVFSLPHNFYFSPQTLTGLLLKGGWQVEKMRIFRRDSFQVVARPTVPQQPPQDPRQAQQMLQAIRRHRYLYYLKCLFLWRKIPAWQRHWMYRYQDRELDSQRSRERLT